MYSIVSMKIKDEHAAKGHQGETKARDIYMYLSSSMVHTVPLPVRYAYVY